jgi:putative ABC transport system permease protein
MDSFVRDVVHALRGLVRARGFTLAAVATLSLAVGASTAILSVVHAVLLRPLAFPRPERLVRLEERHGDGSRVNLTAATFRDVRDEARCFTGLAVLREYPFNLSGGGPAEPVTAARVSRDFFDVLGVPPASGRFFVPDEFESAAGRAAVVSEGLWRRWLGGDASAIGRRLRLDGEVHVVVGVLADRFRFPDDADVWLPMFLERRPTNRRSHLFTTIGRLRDDASLPRAREELGPLASAIRADSGTDDDLQGFALTPLRERLTEAVRPALLALLGAVGLLLAVACVNLASLLIARGARRAREMAIRGALGASRWRVVRQLVTESLVLAVLAAVPGAVLAFAGARALRALAPSNVPRIASLGMDPILLAVALAMSLAAALVFGLWPALQAARTDFRSALQTGSLGAVGPARARGRALLVVAELALVVVLLGGAGLLIRTFVALQRVPLGFTSDRVLTFYVSPGGRAYDSAAGTVGFLEEVLRGLGGLGSVERVAVASAIPSRPLPWTSFAVEGRDPVDDTPGADVVAVSPQYFRLLGIPLLRGRPIEERDGLGALPVVVLSESAARTFWPGQDPLDREITLLHWNEPLRARVVGVVADLRYHGPAEEAAAAVYFSHRQFADRVLGWHFLLKTRNDPAALAVPVRERVRDVDPDQPIADLRTLDGVLSRTLAPQRFSAALVALFAALALALTAVGVYGLVSWTVSERQREIGIRLALGALPRDILRHFAGQGLQLALLGVLLGLPATLALGRALARLLFGVGPADPATLLAVALLVPAMGLVAAWMPARRAAAVDPARSLRTD